MHHTSLILFRVVVIMYTCKRNNITQFTCIGSQMFKGCDGHLLQLFMLARIFVVSILKIKIHTHHRVIMRTVSQILKIWNENILLRFDLMIRNTKTTQQWVNIYTNIILYGRFL